MPRASTFVWEAQDGTISHAVVDDTEYQELAALTAGARAKGTARMLDRLLGHRLPRFVRPVAVPTAPVPDELPYRTEGPYGRGGAATAHCADRAERVGRRPGADLPGRCP
ncbi:hypothetical protein ACFP51_12715 [Streptomyces pratens]|uniref:Uncharacterized protein n=1 Tax=Streptomyces pratens TaxID=887456 RepID=A0ABW1M1R3_9ACTN